MSVSVSAYPHVDRYVTEELPEVEDAVADLSQMGFFGDCRIDLNRRRRRAIAYDNPATARLVELVPGARDWLALVPTAAALDPCYKPQAARFPNATPRSRELNLWLSNLADCRGVRSRAAVLQDRAVRIATVIHRRPRGLSLACGAAHPIVWAARALVDRRGQESAPDITVVDLDATALSLARGYAGEARLDAFTTVRANVLRPEGVALGARLGRNPRQHGTYDLVEAIGLLEYLGTEDWAYRYDKVIRTRRRLAGARTFLRNAYDFVAPGGQLIVGNMLATHPQLAFTLNVVQWPHIRPRTVDDMVNILAAAGIEGQLEVVLPSDGVYALYIVTKPAD